MVIKFTNHYNRNNNRNYKIMEKQIKLQTNEELVKTSEELTDKMYKLNQQIIDLTKVYKQYNQQRNYAHNLLKLRRNSM